MLGSVIITVLNEERHLAHLLDSLSVQDGPFEVLVVDAGSTDDTHAILDRYADEHDWLDWSVEPGCSRGEGRNLAAARARGEFVSFIDGDSIANTRWLREMRAGIEDGAAIVAGHTVHLGYWAFVQLERVELERRGVDVTFPSCNLTYRRDVFEELGGFDPWFITAEDIDLNLRAVDAGHSLVERPGAVVYHQARDTFSGFFKQAFWNGYGRKQLTLKHGNLWDAYRLRDLLRPQGNLWAYARLGSALLGYGRAKLTLREPGSEAPT